MRRTEYNPSINDLSKKEIQYFDFIRKEMKINKNKFELNSHLSLDWNDLDQITLGFNYDNKDDNNIQIDFCQYNKQTLDKFDWPTMNTWNTAIKCGRYISNYYNIPFAIHTDYDMDKYDYSQTLEYNDEILFSNSYYSIFKHENDYIIASFNQETFDNEDRFNHYNTFKEAEKAVNKLTEQTIKIYNLIKDSLYKNQNEFEKELFKNNCQNHIIIQAFAILHEQLEWKIQLY